MAREPVTVSLKELQDGTLPLSALDQAFGSDSLGIIVVTDLPEKFIDLRHKVLSYSSYLANLPEEELASLESPESSYLTGWSLGKEKLKDDKPDTLKGSYYVNCAFHVDPKLECSPTSLPQSQGSGITKSYTTFPGYTTPNLWPSSLPGFQAHTTELCNLIIDTATLVARACDRFAIENVQGYDAGYLEEMVKESMTTKARLLHYFPPPMGADADALTDGANGDGERGEEDQDQDQDNWCATHLDHGCLTGLTSAMYVDESLCDFTPSTGPTTTPTSTDEGGSNIPLPLPETTSPDPKAGLYIQSRTGEVVQVKIPRDCLAFQTGQALEVVTGGRFRAVPHFVRGLQGGAGGKGGRIARNTLAVFTQPNLWEVVDRQKGTDFAGFARGVVEKNY